jgi:hypothetical protein
MSLLLSVALAVLWVQSLGQFSGVTWVTSARNVEATATNGVLGILLTFDSPSVSSTGWYKWRLPLRDRDRASLSVPTFNAWGFGLHVVKTIGQPRGGWRFGGRTFLIVYTPFWLPVILFASPTLVACAKHWQRRRVGPGRCRACGYDLRATPERCPECGLLVKPTA